MSSSEDKDGSKTLKPPDPPDSLDLGPEQSHTQGFAGSNQHCNPDPTPATLAVSKPTTMATTALSQTSTTATTMMCQDTQATIIVSHPSTTATTAVSLQTTATSAVSQSTLGHVTASPSEGDVSHSTSSLSTAASELEAVLNQALPEGIAAIPQGPVTRNVPTQDPTSDLQGSANTATSAAQQLAATSPVNNQLQVIVQIHAENKAFQRADSANPVPGLPEMSTEEDEAVVDSGVAPKPNLGTALVDIMVGHKLSTLQLNRESGSVSAPGAGQFAVGPAPGPGPGTGDVPPQSLTNRARLVLSPNTPVQLCTLALTLMPLNLPTLTNRGMRAQPLLSTVTSNRHKP